MDELAQRLALARKDLTFELSPAHLDHLARRFSQRRVRRKITRSTAAVLATAACALVAVFIVYPRLETPTTNPGAANVPVAPAALNLPDGSTATPLDDMAVVQLHESTPKLARVEVVRGGARFDVVPNPGRVFRVTAGDTVVEVLGTEFTVERIGTRVRVSVLRGRVKVSSAGQTDVISEGETGLFPRERETALEEPPALTAEPVPSQDVPKPGASAQWRSLAKAKRYSEAYSALAKQGFSVDGVADLMLAADVARLSHHPAKAVAPLRRVVNQYPGDGRASAAAFTLGRVLMELGRPSEAAQAFASAGRLDRQGAISENALAREIEAWSRAGNKTQARKRAQDYITRYPEGLRLKSVRRYGGL